MIIVMYNSEVLGQGELWRGSEGKVYEIDNVIPAYRLAMLTARDGKTRSDGMWIVYYTDDKLNNSYLNKE